jgi:hypothetical protein
MASYIKSTDFSVKDDLITGDPDKRIKGVEIDDEFDAIAVAVNTKADLFSPAFLGVPTAATASPGTNTTQISTTAFVTAADTAAITAERNATATLTNKTLTAPVITNANATITSGSITGITDLAVADGGTGRSSLTAENVILGDGTNAVKFVAPGTNGNILTSNGTTWTSSTPSAPAALSTASGAAPSYSARAWVNFDGTGTPSIRSSGNVSSITDNGTGQYIVNLITAAPNTNYAVVVGFNNNSQAVDDFSTLRYGASAWARTTSTVGVTSYVQPSVGYVDLLQLSAAVFY